MLIRHLVEDITSDPKLIKDLVGDFEITHFLGDLEEELEQIFDGFQFNKLSLQDFIHNSHEINGDEITVKSKVILQNDDTLVITIYLTIRKDVLREIRIRAVKKTEDFSKIIYDDTKRTAKIEMLIDALKAIKTKFLEN